MKSFHMYTIAGLCIYIYAVYIMIQCTEPEIPAVIACCELHVSLQEAVLGLKTRSPITVLSKGERASFGSCELSRSHTLEKSRSKEERPAQAIFRQMQTDASRGRQSALLMLLTHWTLFPLPNLTGRLSQNVDHGL